MWGIRLGRQETRLLSRTDSILMRGLGLLGDHLDRFHGFCPKVYNLKSSLIPMMSMSRSGLDVERRRQRVHRAIQV